LSLSARIYRYPYIFYILFLCVNNNNYFSCFTVGSKWVPAGSSAYWNPIVK
ncbi:hypothetical protein BD408DRAFT_425926, partial [Parasitella parasitica]